MSVIVVDDNPERLRLHALFGMCVTSKERTLRSSSVGVTSSNKVFRIAVMFGAGSFDATAFWRAFKRCSTSLGSMPGIMQV
jgi:hypothetical protein